MIVLALLSCFSFETRNKLNSCIRNNLPFCSLRIAFWSKTHLSNLFKVKITFLNYLCSHIIYKFSCSCYNATFYSETAWVSEHLGITQLTQRRIKNPNIQRIQSYIQWYFSCQSQKHGFKLQLTYSWLETVTFTPIP